MARDPEPRDNSGPEVEVVDIYPVIAAIDPIMRIMTCAFDPQFGEAWNRQQTLAMLTSPSCSALVAYDRDGRELGFALIRRAADEAELLLIAVLPRRRGTGIGRLLIEATISLLRHLGIATLFLEVRSNNPAITLYQSLGFGEIGRRPRYYRGGSGDTFDALTYRLTI